MLHGGMVITHALGTKYTKRCLLDLSSTLYCESLLDLRSLACGQLISLANEAMWEARIASKNASALTAELSSSACLPVSFASQRDLNLDRVRL